MVIPLGPLPKTIVMSVIVSMTKNVGPIVLYDKIVLVWKIFLGGGVGAKLMKSDCPDDVPALLKSRGGHFGIVVKG